MDDEAAQQPAVCSNRRNVLAGAGMVGLAGVLCACGGKAASGSALPSDSGAAAPTDSAAAPPTDAPSSPPATTGATGKGTLLAAVAEVPVGGGKVFAAHKVVVTQPKAGHFKAFSTVCPHAGCNVDKVAAGTIDCPCHGSKFHVADASVAHGPAKTGLTPMKVHVAAGHIYLKA